MMSALPRLAALALLVMLAACGGGQSDNRMNLRSPGASQAALHPNATPELLLRGQAQGPAEGHRPALILALPPTFPVPARRRLSCGGGSG